MHSSVPLVAAEFIEIIFRDSGGSGDKKRFPVRQTAALRYVFRCGVSGNVFDQFERQSHAGQNYRQYARNEQRADPHTQLKEAYSLLEVEAAATDADVKKAYRRMMSKNHPDRMMAKGVPPEMIKLATQKTQQVKEAYEFIKQARGLT